MLTYLDISIFQSPAQTLVNTVNTVGVMGKGIALTFKQLYPEMFLEYRRLCNEKKISTGMLYVYRTPNKIIVNFPTKQHWRFPSKLEYIEQGLKKFTSRYYDYGITSVSFPQLGCGNGELSWENQVKPIMEAYLSDLPIPVYIHVFPQDPNFIPERFDADYVQKVKLERQWISFAEFWQDISEIVQRKDGIIQSDLFGPEIVVSNLDIEFRIFGEKPLQVFREDIEEIWNVLRVRGTVSEIDVPQSIHSINGVQPLFDLLSRLPYIDAIKLQRQGEINKKRGLKFSPEANLKTPYKINNLV